MIAVLVVAAVTGYMFISGICGRAFYRSRVNSCDDCGRVRRGVDYASCYSDHDVSAAFVGALWPMALPMLAGLLVFNRLTPEARQQATERKHQRRMEKLSAENDRKKLDIEQTRLNIEFLRQNGVNATVPGMFGEAASVVAEKATND